MLRALVLLLLVPACVPEGKPPLYTSFVHGEVGGDCAADTDCNNGVCMTSHFAGTLVPAPGGYCTHSCSADSECGSGRCVLSVFDGKTYCMAFCDGPSRCRDNYVCDYTRHCEPYDLYVLDCDPDLDGGRCAMGGCIRSILGSGIAGHCLTECSLFQDCPANSSCHYLDDQRMHGGKFKGLVCLGKSSTEVPLGGTCSDGSDCVSGANCVRFPDESNYFCRQLCDSDVFPCKNGSICGSFNPAGPVGICVM